MNFWKIKNNFIYDFFIKRSIYKYYDNVHNTTNKQDFFNEEALALNYPHKKIDVINLIPPYLL